MGFGDLMSTISPSQFDIVADIIGKVKTRTTYAGVLVKVALVRSQAGLHVSTALAVASNKTQPERPTHEYGPLVLDEKWFSIGDFAIWISTLAKNENLGTSKGDVGVKGVWMPTSTLDGMYVPSSYNYLEVDWPSNLYRFIINQNTVYPPSEIPSPVQFPMFPNGIEAVEWWYNVGDITRLDMIGKIIVLLPNYEARIQDVEIGAKHLSFSLDRSDKDLSLVARLFAKGQTGRALLRDLAVKGDGGKFEIESDFSYLKLALVDAKTNETLDYRDVYSTWGTLPKGVRREPSSEDILETIRRGEREDVEFKESLTNPEDIVKTIVAMANTKGGALFIGVNDDGQVVAQKDDATVIEDKIRNWTRDWCEQPILLEMRAERVLEQQILIVLIEQSTNKPCWFRGKGAFIRYGASNRHATRAEVEQMLRKESTGMSLAPVFA